MGGNVSKNKQKTFQQIQSTLKSDCSPSAKAENVMSGLSINVSGLGSHCGAAGYRQTAKASTVCNLDNVSRQLADSLGMLTTEQKAGLGFNVSDNEQENVQRIKGILEQKCGSDAVTRNTMKNASISVTDGATCDTALFIQDADSGSACVMKAVLDATGKIKQEAAVKQTGFDPTAISAICSIAVVMLGGGGLVMGTKMATLPIITIIIGLILLVVGGYLWNKANKDKKKPTTGQILVGVGAFIFLIGLFLMFFMKKGKASGPVPRTTTVSRATLGY